MPPASLGLYSYNLFVEDLNNISEDSVVSYKVSVVNSAIPLK